MSDFTPVTKEAAIAASTAAAFTDEDGRTIVHSVMISGRLMLGADWDLVDLIKAIIEAKEVMWFEDPMGHELALMTTDNRAYKFEVKRPEVSA
jgi:hypothetical protein